MTTPKDFRLLNFPTAYEPPSTPLYKRDTTPSTSSLFSGSTRPSRTNTPASPLQGRLSPQRDSIELKTLQKTASSNSLSASTPASPLQGRTIQQRSSSTDIQKTASSNSLSASTPASPLQRPASSTEVSNAQKTASLNKLNANRPESPLPETSLHSPLNPARERPISNEDTSERTCFSTFLDLLGVLS